jgi:exonuclease 3'-5' domain-containing protein 1
MTILPTLHCDSNSTFDIQLADTLSDVEACITDICGYPESTGDVQQPCTIAVDLEGVQLSRKGRVSLVQLKANHSRVIWLLDITVLGGEAFTHSNTEGVTVKHILESSSYKKVCSIYFAILQQSIHDVYVLRSQLFYDVRRDADALYNLYAIDMSNVLDVQLTELAVRKSNRLHSRHLNGLAKSITTYLRPPPHFLATKEAGQALMNPKLGLGGSYEVFERRPLRRELVEYAAQDVALLANLEATLRWRVGRQVGGQLTWDMRVRNASMRRVGESKGRFDRDGPHRALSPQI